MQRFIEIAAYPLVTGLAVAGYWLAINAGLMPSLAAYCAALFGVACILVHERFLPERVEWRPEKQEVGVDLVYLVLVQMLVPQMLSLVTALTISGMLSSHSSPVGGLLWPHHWSVWLQLALLTILAEFPRYWLHRISHNFEPLWRLHAVHHAPRILYSLNVGRFHPIDRALQWFVEVMPFVLVGVAPEVLSLYFVFYAVTGFYQHSNCRVRLGPLNWIIAGPELHRWHHSLLPEESTRNYGNKLIIWDLIFGTRFLPKTTKVARLGVPDPHYPTGFFGQLVRPFAQRSSVL